MAHDYSKNADSATRLLAKFGASMTLRRVTESVYVPGTGMTPGTTTEHAAQGVKLDYSQRDIDNSRIRAGDQRVYLSPGLAVTPQAGDTLLIGSEEWAVVESRPLAPAGVVVLHDVQVRKA